MIPTFVPIEIPRRTPCCARGGEKLVPGMDYYSLLVEQENKQIFRQDFCCACWDASFKERQDALGQGYWKSRIEAKKETDRSHLSKRVAKAYSLLETVLQQPKGQEAKIFILALFLARAKQLILRREWKEDRQRYYLYEMAGEEKLLTIKHMDISPREIAQLEQSLTEQFKNEQ